MINFTIAMISILVGSIAGGFMWGAWGFILIFIVLSWIVMIAAKME